MDQDSNKEIDHRIQVCIPSTKVIHENTPKPYTV